MNEFLKPVRPFDESKLQSKNVIFTIGISGSGKSTWAKEFAYPKDPHAIIIERDQIRISLNNWINNSAFTWTEWNWSWENVINARQQVLLQQYIQNPIIQDIVIADTNCKASSINEIIKKCELFRNDEVSYFFKLLDVDIGVAKSRDAKRDQPVGEEVIEKQFQLLTELKKNYIIIS